MKSYTFSRCYWKTVDVEAETEEEARNKLETLYLFDDVSIEGYNDELVEVNEIDD